MNSPLRNFEEAKNYFLLGLESNQKELYEDAEYFFKLSLNILPDRLSTLINLFAVLIKLEKIEKAAEIISKAIKLYPSEEIVYLNQGHLFFKVKNLIKALASYDKAIELRSDYKDAINSREIVLQRLDLSDKAMLNGVMAAQTKRFGKALEHLNCALEIDIGNIYAYNNLGNVCLELNRYEEALANYDKAIEHNPSYADAHNNRGNVLKELHRFDEALASYNKAIEFQVDHAEAYNNRANLFQKLRRFEEALVSYDKAIELRADYADAHYNRANVLKELRHYGEALASYDKVIVFKPNFSEAYNNRGNVLQKLMHFEEALTSYNSAIEFKPDYAEAYSNRGIVLNELRRPEDALASYDRAIELMPDNASVYCDKALILLLYGNYEIGFQLYEWRWKSAQKDSFRNFRQPHWLGSNALINKTIFIYAEQGLGDVIQFCRYVALLKQLGAKVILEVPRSLVTLLQSLPDVDNIVEAEAPLPEFDFQCPLLSLPLAFKTEVHTIPKPTAYLKVDSERFSTWRRILGEKSKPRIGLVWSGSTVHKNDQNRSLLLTDVLKYLPPEFEYFSLQKEIRQIDQQALASSNIKHYGEQLVDFAETAALCGLMDLVLSVDTSVAHLSAALGKTTWILLPYVPDWRWLMDRVDSPWYDSVRIYRQEENRQYAQVLERVVKDLNIWRLGPQKSTLGSGELPDNFNLK